jgi:cellulose biosynthesis protein BcsQ
MNEKELKTKKIVITGEKGGTGKSTVTALSIEYVNYLNKKAKLTDLDPLQIATSYVQNCQEEGREVVISKGVVDYQIVDTAGIIGASLNFINQADIIVVPFRAHYPDLKAILP